MTREAIANNCHGRTYTEVEVRRLLEEQREKAAEAAGRFAISEMRSGEDAAYQGDVVYAERFRRAELRLRDAVVAIRAQPLVIDQ